MKKNTSSIVESCGHMARWQSLISHSRHGNLRSIGRILASGFSQATFRFRVFELSTCALLCALLLSCANVDRPDPSSVTGVAWTNKPHASSVAAVSSAGASSIATASSSSVAAVTSGTAGAPLVYGGQTYRTVVIGTQTWMAENLNFTPTTGTSWCYGSTASNCTTYGRLYDWATAKVVCPTGWHLPDTTAWSVLEAAVGGTANAGTKLKANNPLWSTNTGTDNFGFSALPGGYYGGTTFSIVGIGGVWWTATANGSSVAYHRGMDDVSANVGHGSNYQAYGFSVRCLKD